MSTRRPLLRLARWLLLLALLGGLASCAAKAPTPGPQAWIDSPADGATLPVGLPVPVVCRASAPEGVAEVLLEVNGTPYRSMPVAGAAETCAVTIDWLPAAPGAFTLQVTAYDSTGAGSGPATATVKVEGTSSGEPAGTPAPDATLTPTLAAEPDTPTPTVEPDTPTPTVEPDTPTPTVEPTIAPSATPWPPAEVSFTVDPPTVELGSCATLHWKVEYVTAVYLDGEGVVGEGSKEVCPSRSTTYNLHVEAPSGNVDRAVTVGVVIVAVHDGTAPPVPKPKLPEDGQFLPPPSGCPTKVNLDWSSVTDPTGVVYDVHMQWKDGLIWRDVGEWDSIEDSTLKVVLDCGKAYRWHVRARDGAGNVSAWSVTFGFRVGHL